MILTVLFNVVQMHLQVKLRSESFLPAEANSQTPISQNTDAKLRTTFGDLQGALLAEQERNHQLVVTLF